MLKITTEARQAALIKAEVERRLDKERLQAERDALSWLENKLARELLPVIIRSTFGSDLPHAVNAAFKMADDYTAEVERRHALSHPDGPFAAGWPEITGRDDA